MCEIFYQRQKSKNMKKGISVILFIVLVRVCDGQTVIPADTILTILPQRAFVMDTSYSMFEGRVIVTNSDGSTKYIPFTLSGMQALQPTRQSIINAIKGRP